MIVANHHVFTFDDKKYAINPEKNTAESIDEKTAADLTNAAPIGNPIVNIALFVTQECNLNCVYCYGEGGNYGSSGHMASNTAKKAVDWLVEQSGEVKKLGITFFGGEPLMNFPLIKEVVEYANKITKEKDKTFTFGMTTNLSLLDEEKLTFLKDHKIMPLVSFDGPKEIQDKQRPFKNKECSTYDSSLPKIKELLSVMPDISCRATMMEDSDPVCVREALCEIGFSTIHLSPASSSLFSEGTNKKQINIDSYLQMLESDSGLILKNVKDRNSDNLKKMKKFNLLFECLGEFIYNKKRETPCGAGRGYVAVSNSGNIFLCHRFVGTEKYKLGSIYDNKLDRAPYLMRTVNTIEKCSKCFAKYHCAGGCYHDNMGSTGSVFEQSENTCRLMKRIMELTAYISCNLTEDDKEYLVKEKIISEKPETLEDLDKKKQNVMAELEELGLTEEEYKNIFEGLSLDEFKSKYSKAIKL